MDESDAIRATTPAATCELGLSLWHAPSSADLSPLDFSSAASRETPARCDLIDMFIGWRSQALLSARRRCGRNVTQESCARVRGTSLAIWHQHASRGTRDGASGPLLECGSPDLLGVHAIHASCQSVGLSSCVNVGHCTVSSCDKKSDIPPSCTRQARAETLDSETRPTQRANARSRHPAATHAHARLTAPTGQPRTRDDAGRCRCDAAGPAHAHRARKRTHTHTSTPRRLETHARARACAQRAHVAPAALAASCAAGGEAGGCSGRRRHAARRAEALCRRLRALRVTCAHREGRERGRPTSERKERKRRGGGLGAVAHLVCRRHRAQEEPRRRRRE